MPWNRTVFVKIEIFYLTTVCRGSHARPQIFKPFLVVHRYMIDYRSTSVCLCNDQPGHYQPKDSDYDCGSCGTLLSASHVMFCDADNGVTQLPQTQSVLLNDTDSVSYKQSKIILHKKQTKKFFDLFTKSVKRIEPVPYATIFCSVNKISRSEQLLLFSVKEYLTTNILLLFIDVSIVVKGSSTDDL